MKIAIAGHNGFLGNMTKTYFKKFGHHVIAISRNDFKKKNNLDNKIANADVVINFCGARIDKRWTAKYKEELIDSRVLTTNAILASLNNCSGTFKYLINTSAIGVYNIEGSHNEKSKEFNDNFLSKIIEEWEGVLKNQKDFKNYCIIRLGIVIDKKGGFLKKMSGTLKFKMSCYLSSKENKFCFIDSYDFLRALEFVIDKKITGVCNFVSPKSSTNYEVALLLKIIFKAWFIFKVPAWVLKIVFGESYFVLTKTNKDI